MVVELSYYKASRSWWGAQLTVLRSLLIHHVSSFHGGASCAPSPIYAVRLYIVLLVKLCVRKYQIYLAPLLPAHGYRMTQPKGLTLTVARIQDDSTKRFNIHSCSDTSVCFVRVQTDPERSWCIQMSIPTSPLGATSRCEPRH